MVSMQRRARFTDASGTAVVPLGRRLQEAEVKVDFYVRTSAAEQDTMLQDVRRARGCSSWFERRISVFTPSAWWCTMVCESRAAPLRSSPWGAAAGSART